MVEKDYHVNTVRKKMNMIRPFVSWMFASGLITGEQYIRLKAVKNPRGASGKTNPKPYTQKEMAKFWEAFEERWPRQPTSGPGSRAIQRYFNGKGKWKPLWRHAFRLQLLAMVRLALDLGLRAHEIHQLSVDDLHYDNEYIVVWGKADPHTGEKRVRKVPFTTASRRAITEWVEFRSRLKPDHDRAWLVLYSKWRLSPMKMDRFEVLLQSAIGPGWAWHRLRHTCATEWLRAGMPLEAVSRLLGHSDLSQTLCYAQITKSDLQLAVDRHEERFSNATHRNDPDRPAPEEVPAAA
jgi:integrase